MKRCLSVGFLCACTLAAETNFSGVWKANLEKSNLGRGPRPTNYLVIVEQAAGKITQKVGVWDQRGGERRSSFVFDASGAKPSLNSMHGLPMQTKVAWDGASLVLDSRVAGARPIAMHETWALSGDGDTLTINGVTSLNNQSMNSLLVLEKQPDAAGEPLRKPEQLAGERFKNVKVLKDIPASQFLDAMGTFTLALGKNCEFCHVQGKMDADDKKEKETARKMIEMTHHINHQNFDGKAEVRCYTCHKGQAKPMQQPAFAE